MSEPVVVLICIAIVVGCFTIALGVTLAAYKISDWARGIRYSRACGHAKDAVAKTDAADPVWGNLAEHDEAFDAALRDEFPDPAATDDVRSAWMQAPVRAATGGRPPWDSQQFPAVQLVPLPDFPGETSTPAPAAGVGLGVPASTPGTEPSTVLEGIIHATRPAAVDYNADTWFADEMAKLRGWSQDWDASWDAWRGDRELVAA